MNKPTTEKTLPSKPDALFDRVVTILEQAQNNVVRAVNTNMVLAYWLIGREIVQDLQGGEERAAYGKQVMSDLSTQLARRYGNGFSVPNLQNFRKFYLAYSTRVNPSALFQHPIQYPVGTESEELRIQYPMGRDLADRESAGVELPLPEKSYPAGSQSLQGFSSQLSWSRPLH